MDAGGDSKVESPGEGALLCRVLRQESAEAINIMAMRASWDNESFIDPGPLTDEALNKCVGSLAEGLRVIL